MSFFNAIYNPTFNKTGESRRMWLEKFKVYGINVIRVWAKWDTQRGLIDTYPTCSLYEKGGPIRPPHLSNLKKIIAAADDWEIAPKEIAYFLQLFQKPVVDDEPARRGTPKFVGPKNPTTP